MKHLLFLITLFLWLQCSDTSKSHSNTNSNNQTQTNNNDMDKDKNTKQEEKEEQKIPVQTETKPNYRYIDGNNNTYYITPTSLDYRPITKERSSSGTYDGGEPVKKEIDEAQYAAIHTAINAAIENTDAHIDKRLMGSASIRVEGKTYKIAYRSKEKAEIERVLKEVKEEE